MKFSQVMKWLLVSVSLVVFTACGGGGGAATMTTISGVITDDPVAGASVKVLSLSSDELGSATTDSNGSYSVEVDESKIANGFIVEATGGKINGVDFNATMKAIYSANDDRTQANATPITSLVAKMADDGNTSRSGTLIEKRDEALQRLVDMGMVKKADWFMAEPSLVDMNQFRAMIGFDGFEFFLNNLVEDISDSQLSQDNMRVFGMAHGGVKSIAINAKTISIFPGESIQVAFKPIINDNNASIINRLIENPEWVDINDSVLLINGSNLSAGQYYTFYLESTIDGVSIGRKEKITVEVLKAVTLLNGILDSSGGIITSKWKDIEISAASGILSQEYNISIVAALDSQNVIIKKFITIPTMTEEEFDKLQINLPPGEVIRQNYLLNSEDKNASIQARSNSSAVLNSCIEDWIDYNHDNFTMNYLWDFAEADFNYNRLAVDNGGENTRLLPGKHMMFGERKLCAWTLRSSIPAYEFRSGITKFNEHGMVGKEPVLFIHGFARTGNLGGFDGEEYFGHFHRLAQELGYIPFEFDWRTSANFRLVANDLGRAITKITDLTGKKVHIVAHSFGGILTRTLIEGLAFENSYTPQWGKEHIASVTTVGTPHQGVFGSSTKLDFGEGAITFPKGRHGLGSGEVIELCEAVTCQQLGEASLMISGLKEKIGLESTDEGYFLYKLTKKIQDYPNIPTQVLMGLLADNFYAEENSNGKFNIVIKQDDITGKGDDLIHIASQRIAPDLGISSPVIQNANSSFDIPNNIEEHLLGFRTDSYDNFLVGYQDNVLELFASTDIMHSNEEYDLDRLANRFNNNWVDGYVHTTGGYIKSYTFNISKSGLDKEFYAGRMSEVGIQNCVNITADNIDQCPHATWNYFRKFVEDHPAEEVNPPSKILVTGTVLLEDGQAPDFPVMVEIHAGDYSSLHNTEFVDLKSDGTYEANITYSPDTNYTVFAYPENSNVRASSSIVLKTYLTLEESTLHFPTITLVDSNYEEGNLTIKVTNGTTGEILNDFTTDIFNNTGIEVDGSSANVDTGYSVTLPKGDYTVKVSKEGYNDGQAQCTVLGNETAECIVNIVEQVNIPEGTISVVLSWGETPSDLDSHLVRKTDGSEDYHVYYGHMSDEDATLDVDDTSSYGPETITITDYSDRSVYTYYVHNYSGGDNSVLPNSGAKVELNFSGGQRTFYVPNEGGQYWKVFEIENGRIIPCSSNCVQDSESSIVRNLNEEASLFRNLPPKQ